LNDTSSVSSTSSSPDKSKIDKFNEFRRREGQRMSIKVNDKHLAKNTKNSKNLKKSMTLDQSINTFRSGKSLNHG
jgi:hypothetical protein